MRGSSLGDMGSPQETLSPEQLPIERNAQKSLPVVPENESADLS
jgi:hypothetical protein